MKILVAIFLATGLVSLSAMAVDDMGASLGDDRPDACQKYDELGTNISKLEAEKSLIATPSGELQDVNRGKPGAQAQLDTLVARIDKYKLDRIEYDSKCKAAAKSVYADKDACEKRNATVRNTSNQQVKQTIFKFEDGECKEMAKSPSSDDGDCGNASQFEGGLRGENCRRAASTIKDVDARNQAVTQTTTVAATAIAQVAAMTTTGAQADAQKSQVKVMQGLALAKMTSSVSQLAGAAQLKSAASDAEEASNKMNSAYKGIQNDCASAEDQEACFYGTAPKYGIAASKVEYTNYDRLKSGAIQSQDQADRASGMFKTSTITGLADAMVGLQAWQAAKQAGKNTTALNTLPPPSFILNNGTGGSMQAGAGGIAPEAMPTDFGAGGAGGTLLGDVGHPGGGGDLIQGQSFGVNKFNPKTSGVSAGGGAGGGRGGGGGGGQPANNKPKGKQSLGNTGVGEYSLAGGQLQNPKVDNKKEEGSNAFADALAKLFPSDKDGKPVVDGNRSLASDSPNAANGEEQSMAYAADVSIFEQISAKIRQLSNSGRI